MGLKAWGILMCFIKVSWTLKPLPVTYITVCSSGSIPSSSTSFLKLTTVVPLAGSVNIPSNLSDLAGSIGSSIGSSIASSIGEFKKVIKENLGEGSNVNELDEGNHLSRSRDLWKSDISQI